LPLPRLETELSESGRGAVNALAKCLSAWTADALRISFELRGTRAHLVKARVAIIHGQNDGSKLELLLFRVGREAGASEGFWA